MKIVINKCFGGYKLSAKAIKAILKRKGHQCFCYVPSYVADYKSGDLNLVFYRRWDDETEPAAMRADFYNICFVTKDYGETVDPDKFFNIRKRLDCYTSFSFGYDRTDPDLVAVVEELGPEVNGSPSTELHVIEIPDDVEWEITDYDGWEQVEEKHRVWE